MDNGTSSGRNVNDGFFEIRYQQDGVYLSVFPPVGKGIRVEAREVIEKLNRKQIRGFNKDVIELAVLKADKSAVKIADAQQEVKLDATCNVMVTPDKMKAFVALTPPDGGRMLTMEEILSHLARQGVIYGINKTTLESIIQYPIYNEMVCVAEGTPAANGKNGYVEFLFDINKERKPTILEDGRVDFRELNIIESVRAGQKLCNLMPPQMGTPGKTVVGVDIPAINGKPANLPRGRNVEASPDGLSVVASIDGQVCYIDGKINVFANYEVPADVDNSTGNINFVGNVIIRGNVLSGFTVDAGGNVEVWGVVEGAVIKAGGDIILRRGMQGLGKGTLISNGDIIARYIEHSNIEAKGSIKSEAIMHSNIKCGDKLELAGKKGLLVGGTCKVGKEIVAKVIGSHMATVTDIEVGVDPTLRERYKALRDEINNSESDIKKADQAITILKKLEAAGALTPEKQEMMAKSVRTKIFLSNKLNEMKEEYAQIEARLQQDVYGKIRAFNYIYPGTKVAIGTCLMYIKEPLQYCTLYRDGADVRVGPIDKN
ncbi:MAG: FapA family protein [Clostridia bacterium]|nr:FapA family protein [Clostridia bacterium]